MSCAPTEIKLQPARVDLALYAGDGALLRLVFDNVMGAPIPLTGSVTAQVRAERSDTAALQDFAVDLSAGASGVAVLSLTKDQTASLAAGTDFVGVWDVQHTPAGGQPRTVMSGVCRVKQDVTRP